MAHGASFLRQSVASLYWPSVFGGPEFVEAEKVSMSFPLFLKEQAFGSFYFSVSEAVNQRSVV